MKKITTINANMPLFIAAQIRSKQSCIEEIWITLPVTKELFHAVAGALCDSWDDVEISAYSTTIPDLSLSALMDAPFSVINHLAARLENLDGEQTMKLTAIMTSWRHFSTPEQIINYTYNPDKYALTRGISTCHELGQLRIAETDMTGRPSALTRCIDTESLGIKTASSENGDFGPLGYISSKDDWDKPERKYRVPAYLDIRREDNGDDLYGSWHYMDDEEELAEYEDCEV